MLKMGTALADSYAGHAVPSRRASLTVTSRVDMMAQAALYVVLGDRPPLPSGGLREYWIWLLSCFECSREESGEKTQISLTRLDRRRLHNATHGFRSSANAPMKVMKTIDMIHSSKAAVSCSFCRFRTKKAERDARSVYNLQTDV